MTPDSVPDPDDAALLGAWLRAPSSGGGQAAFAALAQRYTGLIYHAALRTTGQHGLAEEAVQNTLTLLARKAASLDTSRPLAPWLHRTACWQSSVLARRERRHLHRIQTMATLREADPTFHDADPAGWEAARPHLDAAIDSLAGPDRQLLLMKYFDGCTFEEMSRRFGGQSAAWRQRGSRALQRLRRALSRRGCNISAAALTTGLGAVLSSPAPAALTISVSSTLAASGTLSWATLTAHSWHLMTAKQILTTAALLAAVLVPLGIQRNAVSGTKARVAALKTGVASLRAHATDGNGTVTAAVQSAKSTPAGDGVDLRGWAEAMEKGPGAWQFATILGMKRTLSALDAEAMEALLMAAVRMDLPTEPKNRLLQQIAAEFQRRHPSPENARRLLEAVSAVVRADTADEIRNLWGLAGSSLNLWARHDPAAAAGWFQAAADDGVFELKRLSDDGILRRQVQGHLFAGMMDADRAGALRLLEAMPENERALAIGSLDSRHVASAEARRDLLQLASTISDSGLRVQALSNPMRSIANGSLDTAAEVIAGSGLDERARRELLIDAAVGHCPPLSTDELASRIAWLRSQSGAEADKAAGYFLGEYAMVHPDAALAALQQALEGAANDELHGAYLRRRAAFRPGRTVESIREASTLTDPAVRAGTLRDLLQGVSQSTGRSTALDAGFSAAEVDAALAK